MGINEEYIKGFGSPKTQYQSVQHYLQPIMENPTTYATHTNIVAANQLIIVQHPRVTDIGWSTLSMTTKCKHMYVTYYISNHTQLAKMSFDEIFDLTAGGVYFNFL